MKTIYINYKRKRGPLTGEYYTTVKDGLNKFISNEENIYINISNKESRNYGSDIEASYLCHGIWNKLMKNACNNGNPYSKNLFYWKKYADDKRDLVFHFDIMNNPKKESCGLAALCLNNENKCEWENIYHTIGNMTPIPWFKLDGGHYINGQALHKSLDERWDLYLQILKDNWNEWNKSINITFEEYMKMTCQQMYYEDIFESIKKREIKDITIKDISSWNNKIDKSSKLISFSLEKYDNADTIIENIIKLIKIRCRVIYLLLSET